MTDEEVQAHAKRIASRALEDGVDFCLVYEDEELKHEEEDTLRAIHEAADEIFFRLSEEVLR